MSILQPESCDDGSGDAGTHDPEQTLLCAIDADGNLVGTALSVFDYDNTTGMPVGPPTFVDPITGDPFVLPPGATLQPCGDAVDTEVLTLCDVQTDNSSVQFLRHYVYNDGVFASSFDTTLDGSVYAPTGTVGDCAPFGTCEPDATIDLNGDCFTPEAADADVISGEGFAADSVIEDDPTADGLCGGTWDRPSQPSPFQVNESFRNATFDQPGPVTQGTAPYAGLTADPAFTGSNAGDPAGQGWLQTSDINSFTNGIWQVPNPFSAAQGLTAEVTWASHDGTLNPNGDGMAFVFTDGSIPPQSAAIGGGGNLGLANWEGGYVAIVMDEYGGATGVANSISIMNAGQAYPGHTPAGGNALANITTPVNVGPKNISSGTTRAQPARLIASIIEEGGETYVSASILWPGDSEPITYFNRQRVDIPGPGGATAGPAPATMRMALYGGSGGAFRSEHEYRDATAMAAGLQRWRAFQFQQDPIPACATDVSIRACVDVTFTEDTQTTGNANPEAYLWLVNVATDTVIEREQISSQPSQVGNVNNMCVETVVSAADYPNIRLYVGADTRDRSGVYGTAWDNLEIAVGAIGCPVTPVRTVPISAPCPLDVRIVGGSGDAPAPVTVVNSPATFEDAPICMTVDGETVPGFRREVRNADGTIEIQFLGTDGIPAVPTTWFPGGCVARDTEVVELCDVQANGAVVAFLRVFTYDENGEVVSVENQDANGNPYNPTGNTTTCGTVEREAFVLCDAGNNNEPFIRITTIGGSGNPVTFGDFQLDGETPYAGFVGPAVVCGGGGGDTNDDECLTDDNGVFFRRTSTDEDGAVTIEMVDVAGAPYVPVGQIQSCGGESIDREVVCWTTTAGGAEIFTGTIRHDDTLPAPGWILFNQNTTPVLPSEPGLTFVICGAPAPDAPFGATEELMCDQGAAEPTTFLRRTTLDVDGDALSTVDVTPAGAPYVPVGPVVFGSCDECCPVLISDQLCADEGSGVIRVSSMRLPDGTIQLLSQTDGHVVDETDVVECPNPDAPVTLSSQARLLAAGQSWTPGADVTGVVTGVGFTTFSGTTTLTDANGTVSAGLPVGTSLTWSVEDANTLDPPDSIAAVGGGTVVWWTER